ncbi:unnamed protein product [Mycena citricolor]|uniref:G-protein coupled receptors family 2 profile 2 domain-containing protein n=1 Tax=Mycena citricolor TaxID=2018698 RepID=A0AAD2K485_9AGAR|nr:unnamed protein product [Mycena citricolor]
MPSFGTVDYLVLGLTIPGTVFAFLVLCAFAYVAWNPISRVHMNRVSLRLLVYALVATCIFGAAYCMGTEFGRHPSPQCDFSVFLMNISLLFSCNMFFCMALNLQLVLVHHVQWKNLELCYMIGSFLLCAACTIPPYAAEQFGWSEAMQSCWYRTSSDATMLRWVIGTQSFWTLFMVTGELIVFFVIMGYLISYALTIRRYRRKPTGANSLDGIIPEPKSPIVKYRNLIIRIGRFCHRAAPSPRLTHARRTVPTRVVPDEPVHGRVGPHRCKEHCRRTSSTAAGDGRPRALRLSALDLQLDRSDGPVVPSRRLGAAAGRKGIVCRASAEHHLPSAQPARRVYLIVVLDDARAQHAGRPALEGDLRDLVAGHETEQQCCYRRRGQGYPCTFMTADSVCVWDYVTSSISSVRLVVRL